MRILYIEASPRGENSNSSRVARAFLDACASARPDTEIDHLPLFETELPAFGREGAEQKMAHIAKLMAAGEGLEGQGEWAGVLEHVERFRGADKVVISSAMWNFSIPYPLKHYIDLICQPGLTFGVNKQGEYVGMTKVQSAQLILSRGSAYPEGFPQEDHGAKTDYQLPYLRHIVTLMGIPDVRHILVEPTDALGPEHGKTVLETALEAAKTAGADF